MLVLTAVLSCLYAELVGYGLHRLLHSELVPWLTRRHMVHHIHHYGPRMKMRSAAYLDGGAVARIGWEWIAPSLALFAVELAVLSALGVPVVHRVAFFASGFLWSLVLFHRAHEAMHVTAPSVFHLSPLHGWFRRARRMHDIHHLAIDDEGRFHKNFGIAFFWFDRLFGTYAPRLGGLSDVGIGRAEARYPRPRSTRDQRMVITRR
jgi:sterol desaturase/sphingolipid hydroxylase (fatty acid hydroxylase superfamily)